jgi:hypothetical protein
MIEPVRHSGVDKSFSTRGYETEYCTSFVSKALSADISNKGVLDVGC